MGAIGYFPAFGADEDLKYVDGSSFGEPDGTKHQLELLEGNGHIIIRVQLESADRPVDLLLTNEQTIEFERGFQAAMRRIGLEPS